MAQTTGITTGVVSGMELDMGPDMGSGLGAFIPVVPGNGILLQKWFHRD